MCFGLCVCLLWVLVVDAGVLPFLLHVGVSIAVTVDGMVSPFGS